MKFFLKLKLAFTRKHKEVKTIFAGCFKKESMNVFWHTECCMAYVRHDAFEVQERLISFQKYFEILWN